jgi:hypothetical protein
MAGNPFEGTNFETDWQNGFNAGMVAPDIAISAPSPLIPEAQDAFNQGVTAGQSINGLLSLPVPVPEATSFDDFAEKAKEVGHLAEPVLELRVIAIEAVKAWVKAGSEELGREAVKAVFVRAGLVFAFEVAFAIAIWGPRRDSFFDGSVSERLQQIVGQIGEQGVASDNLELFMAVCFLPGHALDSGDILAGTGAWHGLFRLDFDTAVQDASQHEHRDDVRILRFQTASPTIVEILSIA